MSDNNNDVTYENVIQTVKDCCLAIGLPYREDEKKVPIQRLNPQYIHVGKTIERGRFHNIKKGTYKNEEVAIKFLCEDVSLLEEGEKKILIERFKAEVAIHNRLRHINIVYMHGTYVENNIKGIVTEIAPLGDLATYISEKKNRVLSDALRLKICSEILEGLQYLHAKGVSLRIMDLRSFLLFSVDIQQAKHVKICDFGYAKDTYLRISSSFRGEGKLEAPELGDVPKDKDNEKLDVFLLGFVLWQIINWKVHIALDGAPEYSSEKLNELVNIHGFRPKIDTEIADKFPGVVEVMKACWDQDPKKRPSVSKIVSELLTDSMITLSQTGGQGEEPTVHKDDVKYDESDNPFPEPIKSTDFTNIYSGTYLQPQEGTDTKKPVKVAIKHVKKESKFYVNELRVIRQLSHPNLVKYFGYYFTKNVVVYVMEWLDVTLHDLLFKPENSKYKEELKWRNKGKLIMQQIVRAINYMHRWRIMHRDIKSENVMIRLHDMTAFVIDLGSSKYNTIMERRTQSNVTQVMTPAYCPPEIYRHQKHTFQSDVYSTGVVMWELRSMKRPWDGHTSSQIEAAITNIENPHCLKVSGHGWPETFQYLLTRCWHKDPYQRPDIATLLWYLENEVADDMRA